MTVSILYKVVDPNEGHILTGTSTDLDVLQSIWPHGVLNKNDIAQLRAMHMVAHRGGAQHTLWLELSIILGNLPDGTKIKVWGEY